MKIAYSPNFDVFPIQSEVAKAVAQAVRAFEAAGAHVEEVKLGITRDVQELGDLWCRLIMPLSMMGFEDFKAGGLDLLRDHRDDFPPQFVAWLERAYGFSLIEVMRDQEAQTEVYDAVQGVLAQYDLLVTPTLACLPVDNAADGNTAGPAQINGVAVNELIGWCLTYPLNYTGNPAASIPAGLSDDGLPIGMQIVGRRYADADVLAASAAFEQLRPWHHTYERCATRPL
jgi:amidase